MSTVLLTGANGFVAVQITKQLLDRGYTVVGTVRSLSKTDYLRKKFASHGDKLQFAVVKDITVPGAFDEVLKQYKFDAVLHTSCPFTYVVNDIEKELLEPGIKGTTEILKSIKAHAPTVKRVVTTSSYSAMGDYTKGNYPDHVYTEVEWSPITYEAALTHPVLGYVGSKALAEKAAWDFIEKEKPGFSLTTLLPGMIYGPPEQEVTNIKNLNESSAELYAILSGAGKPETMLYLWVDVRDIALAHVLAIEKPAAANQRYLISQGRYSPQQFVDFVWEHYPEDAAARNVTKGTPGKLYPDEGIYDSDNSKSKRDLGLTYRTLDETLADAYKRFKEIEQLSN